MKHPQPAECRRDVAHGDRGQLPRHGLCLSVPQLPALGSRTRDAASAAPARSIPGATGPSGAPLAGSAFSAAPPVHSGWQHRQQRVSCAHQPPRLTTEVLHVALSSPGSHTARNVPQGQPGTAGSSPTSRATCMWHWGGQGSQPSSGTVPGRAVSSPPTPASAAPPPQHDLSLGRNLLFSRHQRLIAICRIYSTYHCWPGAPPQPQSPSGASALSRATRAVQSPCPFLQ